MYTLCTGLLQGRRVQDFLKVPPFLLLVLVVVPLKLNLVKVAAIIRNITDTKARIIALIGFPMMKSIQNTPQVLPLAPRNASQEAHTV